MIKIEGKMIEISGNFSEICKEFALLAANLINQIKENKPNLSNLDDDEVLYFIIRAGAEILENESEKG